jgi:signal transduction histidine kinase
VLLVLFSSANRRICLSPNSTKSLGPLAILARLAILIGVWIVPIILGMAGHLFGGLMTSRDYMPASHLVGHSVAIWWVWVPATPIIFWLQRVWTSSPTPALRHRVAVIAGHILTLGALFLVQSWSTLIAGHITGHVSPDITWFMNFTQLVVNVLLYDVFIYLGVIAVAAGIDYARRYRDRDLRASQLETQLERARLHSLQAQLQPHFLFNALNAIAMLVRRDRKQEAIDVVVGFGELLRYVLNESGTLDVSLAEELGFVRRYLDIERVRLGDRLRVTIDVDAEAQRALVPNLVLQPLVENALKHGIVVRPEGGVIRIIGARRGEMLRLEVEDDGPGLDANFSLDQADARGIGLRNLRDRIGVFFGDAGSFSIGTGPSGGTLAVVQIPYRADRALPTPARHQAVAG